MQLHQRRRAEFNELQVYEYPEHLRAAIDGMPCAPGVYVFHGQEGDLPLYIGKSVNLRHRVLSHLRNPEEALMLRQTQRISHIRTAGEIGALLLEASMIKQQHPLLNQKLRRNRQLCSLQIQDGKPTVVYSKDVDFATEPDLYGLFASRQAALQALRDLAEMQKLCYGVLGLEKLAPGKPCFRAMLRYCAGACRGDERRDEHEARLLNALEALRVSCWPFRGAVGLVERHEEDYQMHVIRNWTYLGSVSDPKIATQEAKKLARMAAGFDADGYKILCRPILSGTAEVILL
jgi:excinuclease Cho